MPYFDENYDFYMKRFATDIDKQKSAFWVMKYFYSLISK